MISFWLFRWFRFGCSGDFVSVVLVVPVVSVVSFRLFRCSGFGGFGGFGCSGGFVPAVPVVSVVSFRRFRFGVSGFSTCPCGVMLNKDTTFCHVCWCFFTAVNKNSNNKINFFIVHSTKLLNFDWLRAVQLIPNCTP